MNAEQLRAALCGLHRIGLELHRALIEATRYEFESAHGRIENPYDMLQLVESDPVFAWLRPMTALLLRIDELSEQEVISVAEAAAVRAAAERLVQPPDGTRSPFHDRLRALRQSAPSLVVLHTHVRQGLAALPRAPAA
jgi:hypothetical protein